MTKMLKSNDSDKYESLHVAYKVISRSLYFSRQNISTKVAIITIIEPQCF